MIISLLPSEIARLILNYLEEESLSKTYETFLNECKYLEECKLYLNRGIAVPKTIHGKTLSEYLVINAQQLFPVESNENNGDRVKSTRSIGIQTDHGQYTDGVFVSVNDSETHCSKSNGQIMTISGSENVANNPNGTPTTNSGAPGPLTPSSTTTCGTDTDSTSRNEIKHELDNGAECASAAANASNFAKRRRIFIRKSVNMSSSQLVQHQLQKQSANGAPYVADVILMQKSKMNLPNSSYINQLIDVSSSSGANKQQQQQQLVILNQNQPDHYNTRSTRSNSTNEKPSASVMEILDRVRNNNDPAQPAKKKRVYHRVTPTIRAIYEKNGSADARQVIVSKPTTTPIKNLTSETVFNHQQQQQQQPASINGKTTSPKKTSNLNNDDLIGDLFDVSKNSSQLLGQSQVNLNLSSGDSSDLTLDAVYDEKSNSKSSTKVKGVASTTKTTTVNESNDALDSTNTSEDIEKWFNELKPAASQTTSTSNDTNNDSSTGSRRSLRTRTSSQRKII